MQTPDQCRAFLALFPDTAGGLFALAVCLCHRAAAVRRLALGLLRRVESCGVEGRQSVGRLNYFLLLTYHRAVQVDALARTHPSSPVAADHSLGGLEGARVDDEYFALDAKGKPPASGSVWCSDVSMAGVATDSAAEFSTNSHTSLACSPPAAFYYSEAPIIKVSEFS